MHEFTVFLFTIATGFVGGGLIGSFYRLVTSKPASFQMWEDNLAGQVAAIMTLVFAGPAVIMRNAFRAHVIENRPPVWLLLSSLIAVFWSFLSGVFLLSLMIVA